MKVLGRGAVLLVLAAGSSAGVVVLALGGPAEARAIVRLDGREAIPLMPFGIRTCYSRGFSHAGFAAIETGDSAGEVRARLGQPLSIGWRSSADHRGIWFELQDGGYVVRWADGLDIAPGTPIESVASLRRELPEMTWRYARQCTYVDSNRVRNVTFDGERVTGRYGGIYYD